MEADISQIQIKAQIKYQKIKNLWRIHSCKILKH